MISRLRGTLLSRIEGRVEIATPGGVVYEVQVPLMVAERLPAIGEEVELRTVQVVREDAQELYGFLTVRERDLFQRLLGAKGVGGKHAVSMLSTFSAARLIRILMNRDIAALVQVPGIGKKSAETLAVALSDRVGDLELTAEPHELAAAEGVEAAVQALVALGMGVNEAEQAVRAVLEDGGASTPDELIRKALARR